MGEGKEDMEALEAIISSVNEAGGLITGRTTIQKILYFGTVKGIVNAHFRPHYYGPFSSEVATTLDELSAAHFLDERVDLSEKKDETQSFEWKRYTYSLTPAGQQMIRTVREKYPRQYQIISTIVKQCKEAANLDPNILSWAAKVHFILNQEQRHLTRDEIARLADTFNWKLNPSQIDSAIQLLKELDLLKE